MTIDPQEIKDFDSMRLAMLQHFKDDEELKGLIKDWIKRSEPMIKVFEENKIFNIQLEKKTGKLIIYAKHVVTVAGAYVILRAVLARMFNISLW